MPHIMAQQSGLLEGVKRRDHAPFGEELQASRNESHGYLTANTRQGFTGYEKDAETGLNYAQARFQNSILTSVRHNFSLSRAVHGGHAGLSQSRELPPEKSPVNGANVVAGPSART